MSWGGALGIGGASFSDKLHSLQWLFHGAHMQAKGLMDSSPGQALRAALGTLRSFSSVLKERWKLCIAALLHPFRVFALPV